MNRDLVFLTTGLAFGGAEAQLVRVATRLGNRGWRIGIVSMLPPSAFQDEVEAAGIPVVCLGMRRKVPDPRAVWRLTRVLRKWRPRILHSHQVHANLLGRVARPLIRTPVLISSARSMNEGPRWRELAYRLTDRLCDLTTNVSQAAVDRYVRVGAAPAGRIRAMPNGVDVDMFRPDCALRAATRAALGVGDAFVWFAAGRLDVPKDYPTMLRAFSVVQRECREVILLIAGQGPLEAELKRLSTKLGIGSRVRFLGHRRDLPALMNAADAHVLSSLWEGMPNVLLEAAAVGRPIVATDVGGNREVVRNRESGLLVAPGQSDELARAMVELMATPPQDMSRMGERGRAHVRENHALDSVVDRWEDLYHELWRRCGAGK